MKKNGFRDGFLADILKDLKDQYGNEDNSKGKGRHKHGHKREGLPKENEKPDTVPAGMIIAQKESMTASSGFGFYLLSVITDNRDYRRKSVIGNLGV